MHYYCTYFDRNYLYKGLALYRSLMRHAQPFELHLLCFDKETFTVVSRLNLPCTRLITQGEFEKGDEQLEAAKGTRGLVEYYWTCTPSLLLYVLQRNPHIDMLTYLDADVYFFGDTTPIFDEFGDKSILLIEHRFTEEFKHLVANGVYNVQMMSFRRDVNGFESLQWWRERCLEWCYKRLEDGKLGDQKYLDDWTERFHGVHVLRHVGGGVAPWNFAQYAIESKNGRIDVNGVPLIFYHFHQFRVLTHGRFYLASSLYRKGKELPLLIYYPYKGAMLESMAQVRAVSPHFEFGIDSVIPVMLEAAARKYLPTPLKNAIKRIIVLVALTGSG